MKKTMRAISVETTTDGEVEISQAIGDPNDPDPMISITREQAPIVAAWLCEAVGVARSADDDNEPIRVFFSGDGPMPERRDLHVGLDAGLVYMAIGDTPERDLYTIEISPATAKRLRDQLSAAIRSAGAEMLSNSPESEERT